MRFGIWRGLTVAVALLGLFSIGSAAHADGFGHTLPREVLARDLNTGGPYFAPPIPWGHYAKSGPFDHFYKKPCLLGALCPGKGCKSCGGLGGLGHGGKCGLLGCGSGLFGHKRDGCGDPGCGGGHAKRLKQCGLCGNKGCGLCRSSAVGDPLYVTASAQSPVVRPNPQAIPMASGQCSDPGCGLCKGGLHDPGDPCKTCGGKGCGLCGGLGRLFHHGKGDGCFNCGGRGCQLCSGLKSRLGGLLHHGGGIKYFVGPGGPVPLTPGYVPYVVTTRSPRDFLAFPPYTPSASY